MDRVRWSNNRVRPSDDPACAAPAAMTVARPMSAALSSQRDAMDPKEVRRESMPNMPSAQLESLSLVEEPGAASPIGYPPPPRERRQDPLPTHEGHSLDTEGMAWGHSLDSEGMAWAPPPRADEAVCGASPPGVRVVPRPSTKEGRRGSSLVLPSGEG